MKVEKQVFLLQPNTNSKFMKFQCFASSVFYNNTLRLTYMG